MSVEDRSLFFLPFALCFEEFDQPSDISLVAAFAVDDVAADA